MVQEIIVQLISVLQPLIDIINSFILPGFKETAVTILLFSGGMSLYGIVIWHFYRHLATRDIFHVNVDKYRRTKGFHVFVLKLLDFILYFIKYGLLYPIVAFLWFGILSIFLFFLAKTQPVNQLLLIAISVVSAARIASYYSEDLSKDIAKMLPFALLGVVIVDPTFFSMDLVVQRFAELPSFLPKIAQFIIFLVVLEWILRILLWVKLKILPN